MSEEKSFLSKQNGKHVLLVVLASGQLALCVLALAMPDLIMGEMTKQDAEEFMESVHEAEDNYVTKPSLVFAKIGFFESFINKTLNPSNREGMVGILAFSLLATFSSFFTLLYSIQLVCGCAKDCGTYCKCISEKLSKLAKTNYSSGVSSAAVAAMTGFSVSDLEGGNLGTNFYLQVAGGLFSFIIQLVKTWIEKSKTNCNSSEGSRGNDEGVSNNAMEESQPQTQDNQV